MQFHPPTLDRIRDLKASGADTAMLDTAVSRLRSRQKLRSRHFNDHALSGKLAAHRSAVVGTTADGRTVVMVYRVTARTVIVDMVDEHDAAYRVMREEAYSGKFED